MRRAIVFSTAIMAVLIIMNQAGSADPPNPIALIDKALEVGGGADRIAKFKAVSVQADSKSPDGKGTVTGSFAVPNLTRLVLEDQGEGKKKSHIVFDGEHCWIKEGSDETAEKTETDTNVFRNFVHMLSMPDTLMALKGNEYRLAADGQEMIDGKEAAAIRVSRAKHNDIRLFFDKISGLPVKSETQLKGRNGDEVKCEIFFGDYKVFDGVKHFTRLQVRYAGEDVMEITIKELNLSDKFDPKTFAKP